MSLHAQGKKVVANKTWSGGASGEFNVAGNWSPSGEPGASDIAIIGAGATVDFTFTAGNSIEIIQDLVLASGAQLGISSGSGSGTFVISDATTSDIAGLL